MTITASVMNVLTQHQTEYQVIAHPKCYTSVEIANAAHIPDDHIAKGVLLKDTQGYLLAVIPASQWVDLQRLKTELDRDLILAPEEEIRRLFGDCDPGAVPPLGEAYGVETILDESLTSLANVCFEGGDHKRLVQVSGDEFNALMKGVRHGHISDET